MPDLGQVFGALADPSRRQSSATSPSGDGHGDRADRRAADHAPGGREHLVTLADAGLVESERRGRETRYRLTPAGEEWDDRLDALRRHLSKQG